MDKLDRPCKVIIRSIGTVDQRKGIVAHFRQFQSMGKAVVHRPHIGKSAACIAHRKLRIVLALEEEKSRVTQTAVRLHFVLGVDVVEYLLTVFCGVFQVIHNLNGLFRLDVVVPCVGAA